MDTFENQVGFEPMIPQKQEDSTGKRVACFFGGVGAMVACIVAQFMVSVVYYIIWGIVYGVIYAIQNPGADPNEMSATLMNEMLTSGAGAVFAYHIFGILLFALWYYLGCGKPSIKKSFKNVSIKAVLIATIGGMVMCFMANGIVGVEYYIIPNVVEEYIKMMENAGMGTELLAIIASVFLAPIGEELLCRGIIQHYFKRATRSFWIANILQALMFAIIHMNLVQGIYAFAIGLMLGYLAERYQSIIPCIILHFVVNFSSTFWIDKVFAQFPDNFIAYLILFVVSMVASIGLVIWGGLPSKKNENS